MSQDTPHQVFKILRGALQERDHNNSLLHQQAADLAAKGQLQAALRLLWSSIESAKRLNDDYVLGAARLHMAWAYFAAADQDEWDRAAELCEKAAYHFQQAQVKHEQGIAHLTRGCICKALCDKNQDRWTQGFRSFTDAYILLRQTSEEFAEYAREAYGRLGRKYVELGLAQEAEAKAAETEAASASSATGAKTKAAETEAAYASSATGAKADPNPDGKTKSETYGAPPGAEKARAGSAPGSNGHAPPEQPKAKRASDAPPNSNSSAQDARAEPKTETESDAPGDAPGAKQKPPDAKTTATRRFVFGRASARAMPESSFAFWAWVTFAGACILFGVMLGLLALAFQVLWQSQPALMTSWVIGLIVGIALCAIPLILLAGARQLYVRLKENQAAVFVEHERVWARHDQGLHLLVPFHQDIVALVPTSSFTCANFKRNVIQWDTSPLSAHVEAAYRVNAPDLFWDRVLFNLPRSRAFLIPRPLNLKTAQVALEKHAETLMDQALLRVAMEPQTRGIVANERALNAKIKERLDATAAADGIEFQKIKFSILLGMSDQAP